MAFELPPLPYSKDALAPHISAETLDFHHGKHHKKYVDTLNELVKGTADESKPLEDVILAADPGPLFNNAAQAWNHTFYWNSMKPGGGGSPTGALAEAVKRDFGSPEDFKKAFKQAATSLFGSGWVWLTAKDGKLDLLKSPNADLPMKHGQTALLTCDVWEHAYYIDYRNARGKYVEDFLEHLVNWDFAAGNLQ